MPLRRTRAPAARWVAAFAMASVAVMILLALPSRGAREVSRSAPAIAGPSEAALDAGALDPSGDDS